MNTLYAQLGNTPDLSIAEITRVLSADADCSITQINLHFCKIITTRSAQELQSLLGGTIKILRHETTLSQNAGVEDITKSVLNTLLSQDTHKVVFSIAELGRDHVPKFPVQTIKQTLIEKGKTARYVTGSRTGLSASVLLHQKQVQEILIITTDQETIIAKTVAVQNIDEWSAVDRKKPYANRKKGMLPPKVARMMVNLALGPAVLTDIPDTTNVYDPFCGTGTVLLEALQVGMTSIYGSDQDSQAVVGTNSNIGWFATHFESSPVAHVFEHDATQPVPLEPNSISTIVTEPFLGKQTPRPSQVEHIFTGLERLYLGAFKHWRTILQDGARVVIIFPNTTIRFKKKQRTYNLHSLIDKLETFGYTSLSKPLLYSRKNAAVQREIRQFEYRK
ncbi:MAG: hypothetical protein H6774_03460 [Pseudomonadales bacterium]|nr:hypothetical protein [Pseudomonadales bacterium]